MAAGSAAGDRNRRMTAHSRKYSYDAGSGRRSASSRSTSKARPRNSSLQKKYRDTGRGLKTLVGAAT
jgi:hypothetical protein